MICISINQESRRLALVDMHNAAKQCDLLEIRMDRFGMVPDIAELLRHKAVPVILSCRRKENDGSWDGTEAERLAVLRQCIVHKADYVELELDIADRFDPVPDTKRVISLYAGESDKPTDILARYKEAQKKQPDVIKITTPVKTPEQAWPIVQIVAKPSVPTVVTGVGEAGVMLTMLGRKIGAPWTYAALEIGMEAHPEQPSVRELNEIYHYNQVSRKTRLIGVTGFSEREYYTVAALNAAFEHLDLSARCLPLAVGSAKLFDQVIDAVKLASVVVDHKHREMLASIADKKHASADFAGLVNVLLKKDDQWNGYYTTAQASLAALTEVLRAHFSTKDPWHERTVLLAGLRPAGRTIAADLIHRKAEVLLADGDDNLAKKTAQDLGCRALALAQTIDHEFDTLIVCDDEAFQSATGKNHHLQNALRPGLVLMDLTSPLRKSVFVKQAEKRECIVVQPRDILLHQLELQGKMITGKDIPREVFAKAVPDLDLE